MKVLLYNMAPLYNIGGVEEWLREIAKGLSKRGHKITVCTTNYLPSVYPQSFLGERVRAIRDEIEDRYYDYLVFRRLFSRNFILHPTFLNLLNEHDIIYFENFSISSLPAFRPLIFGFHVPFKLDALRKAFLTLTCMKRVPIGIHVLNSEDYSLFKRFLTSMPRHRNVKLFLIPNGIDCNKFNPKRGSLDESKFKILFLGRLTAQKGVDILPNILKNLRKAGIPFELTIAGPDMGCLHIIKNMVNSFPEIVRYLGVVDKERPELYASSHVTILPSRCEKLSLVLLESMASGTPVICSDLPVFRSLLSPINEIFNFVVNSKDDLGKAFAKRIVDLLTNEQYYNIREAVREFVLERFSLDKIILDFEKMLNFVMNM